MKLTSILLAIFVGVTFFILLPFFSILLDSYLALPVISNDLVRGAGAMLGLLGLGLLVYCSGLFFFAGKGTPAPIEPPKKLVVSGIYKFTRNPIYIGYYMILLGEFFFFGHLLQLVYLFLIIIAVNILVVYHEEPVLKKRFGKDYEKYMKNIPRWLS